MKRFILFVMICMGLPLLTEAQTVRCYNNFDDKEVEIEFFFHIFK